MQNRSRNLKIGMIIILAAALLTVMSLSKTTAYADIGGTVNAPLEVTKLSLKVKKKGKEVKVTFSASESATYYQIKYKVKKKKGRSTKLEFNTRETKFFIKPSSGKKITVWVKACNDAGSSNAVKASVRLK